MDAIHYKARQDAKVVSKSVLGIWVGENESAKYWLTVLNELRNRGVKDILIASIDDLTGFKDAIGSYNRQLRKVTKAKTIFPTDESIMKMLYLATMDITKKWT